MLCMRVLVSGGAGFLGSHLCDMLINQGHEVICVDNFSSGQRSNLRNIRSERLTVIEADIRKPITLPPIDKIYHLASRASPADFTEFPVQIALTNTEGTRRLLDHAVACDARMVFASTSEVYGEPEKHPQPEGYNGNVNIRGPRGCYDESKRLAETLTVAYEERYNLDVRTARIFNTYGTKMREDDGRVVPTFINQAIQGADLTVYGDGSQTRSFCYVTDTINALQGLMNQDGLQGTVVNVGCDNEIQIQTLANKVLELTGSSSSIRYESMPKDDPNRRKPDLTKIKTLLGWDPEIDLEEGLERTIAYYRNKPT